MEKTILSLLVADRFGVLTKVATMFGRRGCNIHSLTVCPTHHPEYSRITVTLYEQEGKILQICKHLRRLEDVSEVLVVSKENSIERTLVLVQVNEGVNAESFDGLNVYIKIRDIDKEPRLIEAMGASEDIDALIEKLQPYGIEQLSRSGSTTLYFNK